MLYYNSELGPEVNNTSQLLRTSVARTLKEFLDLIVICGS